MAGAARFTLLATDGGSAARRGRLDTARGTIATPAFMPVGTSAAVKGAPPRTLIEAGAEIILANTYHLLVRPGLDVIERMGGLHRFMGWARPVLTDSGGFQVMSLAEIRMISDEGVVFRNHVDGAALELTPELADEAQRRMGVDIAMVLDDCPRLPADPARLTLALVRTHAWARRARAVHPNDSATALFGIVQGGTDETLRRDSARTLIDIGFDGYAIGGLAVGERRELTWPAVAAATAELPADRPRYLMGVGTPLDIANAVALGIDLFDCVLPTRNGRNGFAFTSAGRVVIKNAAHRFAEEPLDPDCACSTCAGFSRAYLRHLFLAREVSAAVLLTAHNLFFYLDFMRRIRDAVGSQKFGAFLASVRQSGSSDPN